MKKNNAIRRSRHCVFTMHVHLVFVTTYRRGVFTKDVRDDLLSNNKHQADTKTLARPRYSSPP
ncbi:transposase [Paenalcaligenes hominis]|nr:transposase [Paenalcaligenes hominis]